MANTPLTRQRVDRMFRIGAGASVRSHHFERTYVNETNNILSAIGGLGVVGLGVLAAVIYFFWRFFFNGGSDD